MISRGVLDVETTGHSSQKVAAVAAERRCGQTARFWCWGRITQRDLSQSGVRAPYNKFIVDHIDYGACSACSSRLPGLLRRERASGGTTDCWVGPGLRVASRDIAACARIEACAVALVVSGSCNVSAWEECHGMTQVSVWGALGSCCCCSSMYDVRLSLVAFIYSRVHVPAVFEFEVFKRNPPHSCRRFALVSRLSRRRRRRATQSCRCGHRRCAQNGMVLVCSSGVPIWQNYS